MRWDIILNGEKFSVFIGIDDNETRIKIVDAFGKEVDEIKLNYFAKLQILDMLIQSLFMEGKLLQGGKV